MIRVLVIFCLVIDTKVLGQDDSQYCNISPSHTLCQYKVRNLEVPISLQKYIFFIEKKKKKKKIGKTKYKCILHSTNMHYLYKYIILLSDSSLSKWVHRKKIWLNFLSVHHFLFFRQIK